MSESWIIADYTDFADYADSGKGEKALSESGFSGEEIICQMDPVPPEGNLCIE